VELAVSAFTVPTDAPESDGTFEWDATTLVVVEADGGLGWTYAPAVVGALVSDALCFAHGTPLSAHCAPNRAVHPMPRRSRDATSSGPRSRADRVAPVRRRART
jgi:hypothetical protein